MALDCKRLAEALRRGGDGPVAPLSRLQDTLVLWGALAAVAAVLLLLLVLTLPKPYPGLGLASGCLAAVFAVLLGLSRLVREAYVLKRGRLCESGRLLGFEWERDLGDPRTFAGVALWPEASWFWRLAVLTPGGGWLPMLGGGHGERGRLSGEKGGGTLAEALGVPLVVGESLGALTGWAPGPTLLQSGQRLAGQGLPVLRDIDTTLEAALQTGRSGAGLGWFTGTRHRLRHV